MKIKFDKKRALWIAVTITIIGFTSTFNVVPYPLIGGTSEGYGNPCYSPDMEYHIKRYTTLPKALIYMPSHAKAGVAILYDKRGNEIYRGAAHDIYKPGWFGDHVSFFGGWGAGGYKGAKLPTNTEYDFVGCFSPSRDQ